MKAHSACCYSFWGEILCLCLLAFFFFNSCLYSLHHCRPSPWLLWNVIAFTSFLSQICRCYSEWQVEWKFFFYFSHQFLFFKVSVICSFVVCVISVVLTSIPSYFLFCEKKKSRSVVLSWLLFSFSLFFKAKLLFNFKEQWEVNKFNF